MAAVVEPVGRKANWSVNWRAGGGDSNAGYSYCFRCHCCFLLLYTSVVVVVAAVLRLSSLALPSSLDSSLLQYSRCLHCCGYHHRCYSRLWFFPVPA